jgi:hypothetical protein
MQRTAQFPLVWIFIAVISLPLVANLVGIDGADPVAENREVAAFPAVTSWHSLLDFPAGFGRWFDDHFGFRADLVRWNAESRLFVFGSSSSTAVLPGKDGWLFYADDGATEDVTDAAVLDAAAVANWRTTILSERDWLRKRGIAFLFTIPPDKHVIYPEELPDDLVQAGPISRTDQVLAALADSGATVDLRPALLQIKQRERLYHRTDSHWNERGALVAYQTIIGALRRQNAAVPPAWSRSDFDAVSRETHGRDLAGMLGLTRVLREEDLALVPRRPRQARVTEPPGAEPTAEEGLLITEIPGSSLPKAVVIRDSFASALVPFLSEHFSRAVYVWQKDFDATTIKREQPDVVIHEIVGRHLYTFIPSPEVVPGN